MSVRASTCSYRFRRCKYTTGEHGISPLALREMWLLRETRGPLR